MKLAFQGRSQKNDNPNDNFEETDLLAPFTTSWGNCVGSTSLPESLPALINHHCGIWCSLTL